MIRDKTASYLDHISKELIQVITEDDKCPNVVKDIINLNNLTFKNRDELEEIATCYQQKYPFDVEKLRD
jgi:dynein assembly factor 3